jgi:hypothetical protein
MFRQGRIVRGCHPILFGSSNGIVRAIENAKGQIPHYIYDEKGRLIEIRSVEDYTSALSDNDGPGRISV